MENLKLSLKLNEISVDITDGDGVEKVYTLREIDADRRQEYMDSFEYDVKVVDGEAQVSTKAGFKGFPAKKFLSWSLFDEGDNAVKVEVLGKYPSTVLTKLHDAALKLSALDKDSLEKTKDDLKTAKNDSKAKSEDGIS